jgi:TctA family transporter
VDNGLEALKDALPYLIPLTIVEIVLLFIAIIDLDRRTHVTGNNKLVWVLVIVFLGIIGPVIYFVFGRKVKVVDKE